MGDNFGKLASESADENAQVILDDLSPYIDAPQRVLVAAVAESLEKNYLIFGKRLLREYGLNEDQPRPDPNPPAPPGSRKPRRRGRRRGLPE